MRPPVDQVRRPRDPHLRPGEGRAADRPVERREGPADLLREQDHVLVLRAEDDPVPLERAEVGRGRQGRRRAVPRHGHVGEIEPAPQRGDPRVLDAVLLHLRLRTERDARDLPHGPPVPAADDPEVRGEGEPDEPVGLAPDHPRIDRRPARRRAPSRSSSPRSGSHRGRPVNPGRRSRGRSATRTRSTTSSPARTAPGLNTPTTSKSSRDGGTSSGRSRSRVESLGTVIGRPPARWASASASQASARESRPLASVTTRR